MSRHIKNILINPKFQMSLIVYSIILFLIITSIYFSAHTYFFLKFNMVGIKSGLPEGHVFFKLLKHQQETMAILFAATSIMTVIAITLWGLWLSHKIAGPIYKVCRHLSENKESAISFRKGDFFPELAGSLNDYLERRKEKGASR